MIKYEIGKIVRKIIHRFPKNNFNNSILGFPTKNKLNSELKQIFRGNKVFLFPLPGCPWGYMFQRPQQIASALSSMGYKVIYCVDTSFAERPDWYVRGITELQKNLFLYNDGKDAEDLLEFSEDIIVWQYWPHQASFIRKFTEKGSKYLYDNIDNLSTFIKYKEMENDHNTSIQNAHAVLTTADYIYEEVKKVRPDALLVPNAVRMEDFENFDQNSFSPRVKEIYEFIEMEKRKGQKIIGYYGAIADWFDLELIEAAAKNNPNWTFVLIGEKYPDFSLSSTVNIRHFKRIKYSGIPYLLKCFNVAILPFKINDITLHTSPVKIFEYMAGLKPIVSTNLPEVRKYKSVLISNSHQEFIENIEKALVLEKSEDYKKLLHKEGSQNSWGVRVNEVLQLLQEKEML